MASNTHPWVDLEPAERVAKGKAARRVVARSSHGAWEPAADRPDPIALLVEQAETRVPELVPIRYGRMLESPFAFFRGAALIMASDLAASPRTSFTVQLCGDAHLSNFGMFASPERHLVFDINDFDETLPGPWEWDVKRLAASLEVSGRDLGFAPSDRRDVVTAGVEGYRETMFGAARMGALQAWYEHIRVTDLMAWLQTQVGEDGLAKKDLEETARNVAEARTRDSARVSTRLTDEVDGRLRFVADPPLIVPIDDLAPRGTARDEIDAWMRQLIRTYRRSISRQHHPLEEYRYMDTARKVVGVGSVGTRAWILLFIGRDDGDPLVLQAKEAQPSVLERFLGKSRFANHGRRVTEGQRLMQGASDIFLGWLRLEGLDGEPRDYYVRQLHDWKGSVDVDTMRVPRATGYAFLCGSTLARAHARWGDRIAIASYLGKGAAFGRAIQRFASAYADQNERDYQALVDAVKAGRIAAETGL
jgi:uncharacterized protein (DUF2252 family)